MFSQRHHVLGLGIWQWRPWELWKLWQLWFSLASLALLGLLGFVEVPTVVVHCMVWKEHWARCRGKQWLCATRCQRRAWGRSLWKWQSTHRACRAQGLAWEYPSKFEGLFANAGGQLWYREPNPSLVCGGRRKTTWPSLLWRQSCCQRGAPTLV